MRLPELSDDEHSLLLTMCGYATGTAARDGNRKPRNAFLRLTNKLNEGNPHYVPYEIPRGEEQFSAGDNAG